MRIPFVKAQAAGNDFVLVEEATAGVHDWSALARAICDRHFGVGGDGLLVLSRVAEADFRMRMFNPDGSEDTCGNGLRCAVRYVVERGWTRGEEIVALTRSGRQRCRLHADGRVTVTLGRASFSPTAIPARTDVPELVGALLRSPEGDLRITSVSTGTAHTILFGDPPDDDRFVRISRWLETHPLFPERTSVLWATPRGANRYVARIWERGVGETLACGTGAAAIAAAAIRLGQATSPVVVHSRGGALEVGVSDEFDLWLTGPAEEVFSGEFRLPEAVHDGTEPAGA